MGDSSELQRQREASKHVWLEEYRWNVFFSVAVLVTFTVPPASLAGHQPGRAISVQTLEGFRVLQPPLFGFPSCPSVWCLVLNGKSQRLHFYKVLEQSIRYKPHFSEVSNTLALTELKHITALRVGQARPGSPAVPRTGLVAARAHCLSHEGSLKSWEPWKNYQYSFFLDEATRTDTISAWLEVTDGAKSLEHSFQTAVQE